MALLRSSWKGSSDGLENVIDAIIDPMIRRFCPPLMVDEQKELDEQATFIAQDYAKILAPYPYDTLKVAWLETIAKHRGAGWPDVAQFRDAAVGALHPASPGDDTPSGRAFSGRSSSDRGIIWKADEAELRLFKQAGGVFASMTYANDRYLQQAREAIARKPAMTYDRKPKDAA